MKAREVGRYIALKCYSRWQDDNHERLEQAERRTVLTNDTCRTSILKKFFIPFRMQLKSCCCAFPLRTGTLFAGVSSIVSNTYRPQELTASKTHIVFADSIDRHDNSDMGGPEIGNKDDGHSRTEQARGQHYIDDQSDHDDHHLVSAYLWILEGM